MEGLRKEQLYPRIHSLAYWQNRGSFFKEHDVCTYWVILAVREGQFEFKINNTEGIAECGDLVICPKGTVLHRKVITTLSFYFFNIHWFHITDNSEVPTGKLLSNLPIGKITIQDRHRLLSNYYYLNQLLSGHDLVDRSRKDHILQDIWQLHCMESDYFHLSEISVKDPLMDQALMKIKEDAFEPFNMKSLSTNLNLSPVQFTRRFRAYTGMTPRDYLSHLRLDKAKNLLTKSNLTIEEIAIRCGFDNGLYFSRVFSKKMKTSPSQYRRDHCI